MNASRLTKKITAVIFLTSLIGLVSISEAYAQYFSFGKNRVQYKTFDWRFIQSEHFDVYYYQSKNYDLANYTAISLEASLKQLQEDFNHQIAERIQVIVYDSHNDFSQTNVVPLPVNAEGIGGVTDAFKNRITMPFSGNYTEFRSTLHHELVHAVMNDMYYGGTVQSRLSGEALQIPLWLSEGLAEYTSNGWDTNSDIYIRDATINDYLPPIPRLRGYYAYRGGQSVWNYIVEEYGREKIGEIMQTMKSQRSVNAAFQRSLGLSVEELSKSWIDYNKKLYFPEVAEREQIGNFATLLTERSKAGTYNTSPAVSPQGDKIALITNARGFLDVVVISAVTGNKLKTLIKGGDNVNFEELNILNPNLSWSPDGSKITLSTKTKGADNLAIVDYETGNVRKIEFPELDAIGSVAWAPDGEKIAFDGSVGPFQDIFVYNLETQEFTNLTNDVISDYEPSWSADSRTVYFTSARGDNVQLNQVRNNTRLLAGDYLYSTDIYSVTLGENRAVRLTKTPGWNEKQSATTRDGKLIYISDENGIPNVYELNLDDRTTRPLTNLQTGVLQMSVSSDGSRLAVNSINEGYLDIFLVRSPFLREIDAQLKPNHWAERRARSTPADLVPAIGYTQQMLATPENADYSLSAPARAMAVTGIQGDTTVTARPDSVQSDTTQEEPAEEAGIDFRNYVFDDEVENDTAFTKKYLEESKFEPDDNTTEDGRYSPKDYRLKFSTDFVYGGGSFSTYYGAYGTTQIVFSDLLGNHQIAFGSNLVFDLRNSDYFLQYAYLKQRTNYLFNFFHSSQQFQSFSGQLYRFRTFGGGVSAQYPIDKFRRLDLGLSVISLSQDFSVVGRDINQNEESTFAYPQLTYTQDNTLPGFITPASGSRFAVSLSASPPITNETLQFASVLGDYRKYFNLGSRYSFALRGSGAASFGRDSQTFFMGGMLGWLNRRFSENTNIPIERLGDTFFTLPALPLRGHEYNSIYGDRFSLFNAEFRFPLFAALLPGPIPIIPLYNLTGVAFVDAGMAWGQRIPYNIRFTNGSELPYAVNESDLDFKIQQDELRFIELNDSGNPVIQNGNLVVVEGDQRQDGVDYLQQPFQSGDVLIGAGFGLRTILLGFPLRYDVGWPYFRDGFDGSPIHYISIGIDF